MDSASDPDKVSAFRRDESPVAAAYEDGISSAPASAPASSGSSPPSGGWGEDHRVWLIASLLILAVGLVFGQTVGHEFIGFDDQVYVYENTHVNPGLTLAGLRWAFADGGVCEWCPLALISHMVDCQLYGLRPAGHFLTNVLLHAATAVLLFLVLLRMTGQLWPSAWVAAVFAVHPLHVESVAWVAERRDLLSGLFFMLTLGAYTLYAERPSLARYLPVMLLFALGLMSKPILVTLPCVLLLLDYWPLDRFRRETASLTKPAARWDRLPVAWRLVLEKVPLFTLSAAACLIAMSFHSPEFSVNPGFRLPLSVRLSNALVSYAAYVGQTFWPMNMIPYYPFRTDLSLAEVAGSLALLVAITALALYCWRSRPYLLVGWLWFLGVLAPVSGIMPVGILGHARADRYTYLSQIGLSVAVAWLVWDIYRSRESLSHVSWRRWALAAVSGATLLALAVVAWRQTTFWRDGESLWMHTVECDPENRVGRTRFAQLRAIQGRTAEAIDSLREFLKSDSLIDTEEIALLHMNLADLLVKQGDVDEAITHYEETVRLFPKGERGRSQLAAALAAAGRLDEAIVRWREAVRIAPEQWLSHLGLAKALLAAGDSAEAAAECNEILDHEPGAIDAVVTLGMALLAQGNTAEAVFQLERAVRLNPRHPQAQFQLGLALGDRGESAEALAHLNEAVRLQPDSLPILWQTAWILATDPDPLIRDGARAVELAKKAVDLSQGQDLHALDALAAALAETGQFPRRQRWPTGHRWRRWHRKRAICPQPWPSGSACIGRNCRFGNRRRRPGGRSRSVGEAPTSDRE